MFQFEMMCLTVWQNLPSPHILSVKQSVYYYEFQSCFFLLVAIIIYEYVENHLESVIATIWH
jgi:hypothetical protein